MLTNITDLTHGRKNVPILLFFQDKGVGLHFRVHILLFSGKLVYLCSYLNKLCSLILGNEGKSFIIKHITTITLL